VDVTADDLVDTSVSSNYGTVILRLIIEIILGPVTIFQWINIVSRRI